MGHASSSITYVLMTKNIRTHQCLKSIVKGEEIHAASSLHVSCLRLKKSSICYLLANVTRLKFIQIECRVWEHINCFLWIVAFNDLTFLFLKWIEAVIVKNKGNYCFHAQKLSIEDNNWCSLCVTVISVYLVWRNLFVIGWL